MKTKRLVFLGKKKPLNILDRSLKGTNYQVFPKTLLIDVIGTEKGERLSSEEYDILQTSHLDFVIVEGKKYSKPIFAVEFAVPQHLTDKNQARRDILKNGLCAKAKFPLLRIGDREIAGKDQITLLEFMLQRLSAWQKEEKKILKEIESYINPLEPEVFESLTDDGILDQEIDPTVIFDFRHPFSGVLKVAQRLGINFGILTPHMMSSFRSVYFRTQSPIVCYVNHTGMNFTGYDVTQTYSFKVVRETQPEKSLSWATGKSPVPGATIMFEGKVDFSMRWALPVSEDYGKPKNGITYYSQKGVSPYAYSIIPGIHILDIASWFCNYLALREIENWAEENLDKRVKL